MRRVLQKEVCGEPQPGCSNQQGAITEEMLSPEMRSLFNLMMDTKLKQFTQLNAQQVEIAKNGEKRDIKMPLPNVKSPSDSTIYRPAVNQRVYNTGTFPLGQIIQDPNVINQAGEVLI